MTGGVFPSGIYPIGIYPTGLNPNWVTVPDLDYPLSAEFYQVIYSAELDQ